jgi:hypothetical protein
MTRKSDLQKEIDKYALVARAELLEIQNSGFFGGGGEFEFQPSIKDRSKNIINL